MIDAAPRPRLALCEDHLRITDVAALLGVHRTTVNKLIDCGELAVVALGPDGGARRVPESSLTAYLERRGVAFMRIVDDEVESAPVAGAA